jgi:hypothetical protein
MILNLLINLGIVVDRACKLEAIVYSLPIFPRSSPGRANALSIGVSGEELLSHFRYRRAARNVKNKNREVRCART